MHIRVQAAIVAKYCAAHGYNFWRGAGDMAALANCATYSAMLKSSTRIVKCTCEKCKAAYVRRKAYMKTFKKGLAQGVLAAATRRIQGQTVGNKVGGPPFEVKPSPGIVTAAGPVPGITLAERKIAERKLAEAAHKAAAKGAAAKEPARRDPNVAEWDAAKFRHTLCVPKPKVEDPVRLGMSFLLVFEKLA